jgi:anaerobic magnesium-protoporphyrin IX monomethyl ester cyclase
MALLHALRVVQGTAEMRVMLIAPTHAYRAEHYPTFLSMSDFPSGLAYLAGALKAAGHEVYGLNMNNDTRYKSAYEMVRNVVVEAIDKYQPELIGIGGLCIDYYCIRDTMELIRMAEPNIPIVLGGGIVNNDAEFIFDHLKPDYAVVGEGEEAIVRIANGGVEKGIIQSKYGDPDTYAMADYEAFGASQMVDTYSMATRVLYRYSRTNPRPFIIVTARSCPFRCSFCVHNHGAPYRARSIPNIMEEIKVNYEKYKFNILLILDELFAVNNTRLKEFCDAVIEGKKQYGWDFDWTFQCHASANFDLETLKLAHDAGCYMFSYGIESASQTVLDSMEKKSKVEQIVNAIQLAKEAKVGFSGNLIFGDIAETDDTMAESLSFWLTHGRNAFIFLSNITPYPGSKLFDLLVEKGAIKDKVNYYENIENIMANMTKIPQMDWESRLMATNMLERGWFFAKHAQGNTAVEPQEHPLQKWMGPMHLTTAKCPHCGEIVQYRQPMGNITDQSYLGVGCTSCQQKIRVKVL